MRESMAIDRGRGKGGHRTKHRERREHIEIDRGREDIGFDRGRGGSMRQSTMSQNYQYQKPLGEKVKDCCRFTIAFIFSNVGVCGLMVGYTFMGAKIFQSIEAGEANSTVIISPDVVRDRAIQRLWNITVRHNVLEYDTWNATVTTIVCDYQKDILDLYDKGWDGESDTLVNKWTPQGAFLYSLTVITTIGYGHIAPKTEQGKVITIFYTIVGMPVFLLYMANMGDILAKSLKWSYAKLCICRKPEAKVDTSVAWRGADNTLRAPGGPTAFDDTGGFGADTERDLYTTEVGSISTGSGTWSGAQAEEKTDITSVNIPISVSLIIMGALLAGGAWLFMEYQTGWDFATSLYFCFISLTTIGFGDYVPGENTGNSNNGFIYCSIYLMSGLALLSMCFNLMQEEVVHKVTACLNMIRLFKRRDND